MSTRNIVLFVNHVSKETVHSLRTYGEKTGRLFRVAVIRDSKKKKWPSTEGENGIDLLLVADFSNGNKIAKALLPYRHDLMAITCRGESNIPAFSKIIPNVPYLKTPTPESLFWATDKIAMRERFSLYDK